MGGYSNSSYSSGGQEESKPPPPCPECAAGKCANCDGKTWNNAADELDVCPCATNGHPRRTAG